MQTFAVVQDYFHLIFFISPEVLFSLFCDQHHKTIIKREKKQFLSSITLSSSIFFDKSNHIEIHWHLFSLHLIERMNENHNNNQMKDRNEKCRNVNIKA